MSIDLAQSSLKDLLKICRAHSIMMPEVLPKDKQFYVDLIVRHREAAGMAGTGAGAGAMFGEAQAAMSAAAAASSSSFSRDSVFPLQQREGAPDSDDFVQVWRDDSLSSSVAQAAYPGADLRSRASSRASAAAASFVSAVAAAASSASSSIAAAMPSAAPAAAAAAAASALAAPSQEGKEAIEASQNNKEGGDSGEVEYHDDEEDEADAEFIRSPFVQKITSVLQNIAVFDWLERHTSIQRFYWLVLLILVCCSSIFLYVGVLAVFNFVCFIYPAYQTHKTLEGRYLPGALFDGIEENHSIEVHRYWLTYWCVYGLFKLVEFGTDYTLFWLPYYDPAKVIFLVWCFHPSSQGCAVVYRWVIRPLFLPREEAIDNGIARLTDGVSQALSEVRGIIVKNVAKRIAGTEDTPKKDRDRDASRAR